MNSRKSSVARLYTEYRCASLNPPIDPTVPCISALCLQSAIGEREAHTLDVELFCELCPDLSLTNEVF